MAKNKNKNLIVMRPSTVLATALDPENLRDFFRIVTAKQNELSELFPSPAFVSIKDFAELNSALAQKMVAYEKVSENFRGIVSFKNLRTREFVSWENFVEPKNWAVAEITESITLKWDYVVLFKGIDKPCPFTVSLRCASALRPQQFFQVMMSSDHEDVHPATFKSATMTCKVTFSDVLISQELLDIVARWNKARRRPEPTIVGLRWCCNNSETVNRLIAITTPLVTLGASLAYFHKKAAQYDFALPATAGFVTFVVQWMTLSMIGFFVAQFVFSRLGGMAELHLDQLKKIHIFELTHGDQNHQAVLSAHARRALTAAALSTVFTIIWNIIATWIAVKMFGIQ